MLQRLRTRSIQMDRWHQRCAKAGRPAIAPGEQHQEANPLALKNLGSPEESKRQDLGLALVRSCKPGTGGEISSVPHEVDRFKLHTSS